MREVYLDNSATTRVLPEVVEVVGRAAREDYGNPSSRHSKGLAAERAVGGARAEIARVIGCEASEVLFTSGGTEANNLAIKGFAHAHKRFGNHLITTAIEHPSVLAAFRSLEEEGFEVTYLPVTGEGLLEPDALARALRRDTVLVSIMHVNNEVGSVQPLAEVSAVLEAKAPSEGHRPALHVDAVQSFCKLKTNVHALGAHLLSLSAHKLHGPKGVGALYVRRGTALRPLLHGGDQERGMRAGTENVPGIVGLGEAVRIANRDGDQAQERLGRLRKEFLEHVLRISGVRLNSPPEPRGAPHIVSLSFPGIPGDVLAGHLEGAGIYVSTGAACTSRKARVSHVLEAMKLPPEVAGSTVRVSFSLESTLDEVRVAAARFIEVVSRLAAISRR